MTGSEAIHRISDGAGYDIVTCCNFLDLPLRPYGFVLTASTNQLI